MGAWDLLGMEPPVGSDGEFKCQLVVLDIISSDIDIITVRRNIVIGLTLKLNGLPLYVALLYIAGFGKLASYPGKIIFRLGDTDACKNRFKMLETRSYIFGLYRKCFSGSFKFRISVKILYGIFLCGKRRIKGNGLFFTVIIVIRDQLVRTGIGRISICIQKFAPYTILIAAFRLFKLPELFIKSMGISFDKIFYYLFKIR